MSNCDQWRELLSAFADGEGTPEENREAQLHLLECENCRRWLEAIRQDQTLFVRAGGDHQADLLEPVMRRVSTMSSPEQPQSSRVVRRRPQQVSRWVEVAVGLCMLMVVAAIIMPTFSRSRAKAMQSSSLSNIKQIMLGFQMYAQDYDDHLPLASNWWTSTQPYLKNTQILIDPSDPDPMRGLSYCMVPRWSGAKQKDIPDPGDTIILYEGHDGVPAYWHNDMMDVAYADGHAKVIAKLPPDALGQTTGMVPGTQGKDFGLTRGVQLAYDAACELWVSHLQEAVISAERTFYDRGGFVLTSKLEQGGDCRQAEIVGKVPTAEVANTLNALATLGYVASREVQGQDLTDQYVAGQRAVTETERRGAQLAQEQAQAPAAQRSTFESGRTEARQQLGQAQDQLVGVERKLALATIDATLLEKSPTSTAMTGVAAAFHSFLRPAVVVGTALVWVLLYGLFAVPVVAGVVLYRRRRRRS